MRAAPLARLPVAILWSLLASLLPEASRARIRTAGLPLSTAAIVTGALEAVLGLALGVTKYADYFLRYREAAAGGDLAARLVFGGTLWIGFLFFSFWGWFTIFLCLEGAVRTLGGVTGHPTGLLALAALERIVGPLVRTAKVDDLLEPWADGFELRSVEKKPWSEVTGVEIDGRRYHLDRQSFTPGETRPYLYRLLPAKPHHAAREIVRLR